MLPAAVRAQTVVAPSDSALRLAAHQVIAKVRYCAFMTTSPDGGVNARVVQQFTPTDDFTTWIGTNPRSRKVADVLRDPHATLLCEAPSGDYVTLIGKAAVVRDATSRAQHWNPEWKPFYKDEYRGDDYVLIELMPEKLEIVSYELGIVSRDSTWAAPSVRLHK